ncbi:hypothetical protein AALA79_01640 [Lachnospiraceae bacterium 64-25]
MEDTISRKEHEEFARRIDAENERQNRRIALLEENGQHITSMTVSIEKMAVNMENMLAEQKKVSERLEKLEEEPAEAHKQIRLAVMTAIVSTVVGAAVTAILMLL